MWMKVIDGEQQKVHFRGASVGESDGGRGGMR